MNFAIDNTVTDPSSLAGYFIGSAYLVPPVGAEGLWADKEDQIATWGGSVWSFTQPLTGSLWQITSGPNVGKIYTRTSAVNIRNEIVPNSEFIYALDEYPDWELVTTGSGTAEWTEGIITLENPASASHSATAKVTISTVPGSSYNLSYILGTLDAEGDGKIARIRIREQPSENIITDPELELTDDLTFVAVTDSTSVEIALTNTSEATTASEVVINSLSVKREAELMVNGDFASDDGGWTIETPWVIDAQEATATIDYSGHEQFPALRKTVSGLVVGRYYRISLSATANFQRGTLSVFAGGVLLGDVSESDTHVFFFKAAATSVDIEFPLTKIGPSTFDITLDDVSVIEALWYAGPVLKGEIFPDATCLMTPAISRRNRLVCQASTEAILTPGKTISPELTASSSCRVLMSSSFKRFKDIGLLTLASAKASAGSARNQTAELKTKASSSVKLKPSPSGKYLVRDAVNAILNLWGGTGCCDDGCDGQANLEALEKLNAAMQKLSGSGKEWGFVSNVPMTLNKGASADSVALPENVLYVRRVNWLPALNAGETVFGEFALRPVTTRQELESFRASHTRDIWPLSSAESSLAPYKLPLAYFTEAENTQTGFPDRPPELRLMLAPVPTMTRTWKVQVDACIAPPRYTCKDVNDGVVLAVPHKYAETLLVPLARYYAMTSRYFTRPELADAVKEQARDALLMIGEIQPASPEASKESKPA